jgi:SAM-dependent methyltransferase
MATDLDTRFLEGHGRTNLEVRTHNIVTDPVEEAAFDLIHARAVLVHLPDRDQVLKRLVAALRPGGWLLIEDVDFGGATASVLGHYVTAQPPEQAAVERIYRAVAAVFTANGADPVYGSRLTGVLAGAGLAHVSAELHTPVVAGGSEQWVRGSAEQLAERLVATGITTADDIAWFLEATQKPDTYYLPPLMVSAWGQRDGRRR